MFNYCQYLSLQAFYTFFYKKHFYKKHEAEIGKK